MGKMEKLSLTHCGGSFLEGDSAKPARSTPILAASTSMLPCDTWEAAPIHMHPKGGRQTRLTIMQMGIMGSEYWHILLKYLYQWARDDPRENSTPYISRREKSLTALSWSVPTYCRTLQPVQPAEEALLPHHQVMEKTGLEQTGRKENSTIPDPCLQ